VAPLSRDREALWRIKWQLKWKAEDEVKRIFLMKALIKDRGNIFETALDVEMDRKPLQNLIRKHRIVVKESKDSCSSSQQIENQRLGSRHG
jgi:hypothetical protein